MSLVNASDPNETNLLTGSEEEQIPAYAFLLIGFCVVICSILIAIRLFCRPSVAHILHTCMDAEASCVTVTHNPFGMGAKLCANDVVEIVGTQSFDGIKQVKKVLSVTVFTFSQSSKGEIMLGQGRKDGNGNKKASVKRTSAGRGSSKVDVVVEPNKISHSLQEEAKDILGPLSPRFVPIVPILPPRKQRLSPSLKQRRLSPPSPPTPSLSIEQHNNLTLLSPPARKSQLLSPSLKQRRLSPPSPPMRLPRILHNPHERTPMIPTFSSQPHVQNNIHVMRRSLSDLLENSKKVEGRCQKNENMMEEDEDERKQKKKKKGYRSSSDASEERKRNTKREKKKEKKRDKKRDKKR